MALPAEKTFYTLEEYFALSEHEGDTRYEYHFGEVVAMAGALLRHNSISGNLYGELRSKLKGRRCKPFNSDSRLKVENALWVYPDVMVSCHEDDINARLYVQHPSLIIEVLSDSTRQKDYMLKKQYYFKMPDLQYYILVESEQILIDVYERQGETWTNKMYTGADEILPLPLLNIEIAIADIYEWVDFEEK